ncbi:TetR/AcrR family transcriptional regulator [Rothia halotolerans]|uniref:TetR/AcrR family transcriptional regulator n=1 Tax=Rothia halotolerans TaxID=405770 RepID=UPI00101C23C6|nr:TetR family transcriptional regulator [Rothia halotolerans]
MRKGTANDPGRRQRIREAAAAVIADEGVEAATYRRIAARAQVPLGSMTYYFPNLAGLITSAFELLGEQLRPLYDAPIRDAADRQAAIDVLVEATCGSTRASRQQLRLFREMYHYGSHNPTVATHIASLEADAIEALRSHFTERAARAIDALVEGWWIYQSWNPDPLDPDMVRRAFTSLAGEFDSEP